MSSAVSIVHQIVASDRNSPMSTHPTDTSAQPDERLNNHAGLPRVNLGAIIDRSADPHKVALIGLAQDDSQSARAYTYGELDALADGVARGLLAHGLSQGDRVAILAANSPRYVATVLGIMRAGLIAVPVNFKFPVAQIDYVIGDSGAKLVFVDAARKAALPEGLTAVALDESENESFDRFVSPGRFESIEPTADDTPAMMLYTSGSTGRPKGVVLSHASQWWVVQTRLAATPLVHERPLIAAPLYHMNAMALVLLALASHASTVLLPQFSAARYLRAIGQYRCTWLTAVPPMIAMMLQERDLLAHTALDSVRAVRMGSAPVSSSLLEAIHRILPNARIINAYGTTEGGPVVFGPHPDGLPTPPMSVGYPHPAVAMRLVRDDDDPAGQGMLALRSPGQMLRYHQRPDIAPPFDEQGYYLTGDVFRRDADGFHYFVGRRDDMFVCGGENIYPGEVERMLETHPAIEQAAVIPVDDEIKGQKPVAFVVLRTGHKTDEAALKTYSLEHAPAYQHPRKVWIIAALPLASTNKVDRALLKQWAAQH